MPFTGKGDSNKITSASESSSKTSDESSSANIVSLGKPPTIEMRQLWRGDLRPLSEIPEGFEAQGTNTKLEDYLNGDRGKFAFVATTTDKNVAPRFPGENFKETSLYEIYLPEETFTDVNKLLPKLLRDGKINFEDYITYYNEHECVVLNKIPSHAIKGAYSVTGPIETSDQSWFYRTVHEEFTPNPKFISPESIQSFIKYAKSVGWVLNGVGIVADGYSLCTEYQKSRQTGSYDNTYKKASAIASGWTGAHILGVQGAQLGAKAALPFGPHWMVAGAFGGGLVGSCVGYFCGHTIGETLYSKNMRDFKPTPLLLPSHLYLNKYSGIRFDSPEEQWFSRLNRAAVRQGKIMPANTKAISSEVLNIFKKPTVYLEDIEQCLQKESIIPQTPQDEEPLQAIYTIQAVRERIAAPKIATHEERIQQYDALNSAFKVLSEVGSVAENQNIVTIGSVGASVAQIATSYHSVALAAAKAAAAGKALAASAAAGPIAMGAVAVLSLISMVVSGRGSSGEGLAQLAQQLFILRKEFAEFRVQYTRDIAYLHRHLFDGFNGLIRDVEFNIRKIESHISGLKAQVVTVDKNVRLLTQFIPDAFEAMKISELSQLIQQVETDISYRKMLKDTDKEWIRHLGALVGWTIMAENDDLITGKLLHASSVSTKVSLADLQRLEIAFRNPRQLSSLLVYTARRLVNEGILPPHRLLNIKVWMFAVTHYLDLYNAYIDEIVSIESVKKDREKELTTFRETADSMLDFIFLLQSDVSIYEKILLGILEKAKALIEANEYPSTTKNGRPSMKRYSTIRDSVSSNHIDTVSYKFPKYVGGDSIAVCMDNCIAEREHFRVLTYDMYSIKERNDFVNSLHLPNIHLFNTAYQYQVVTMNVTMHSSYIVRYHGCPAYGWSTEGHLYGADVSYFIKEDDNLIEVKLFSAKAEKPEINMGSVESYPPYVSSRTVEFSNRKRERVFTKLAEGTQPVTNGPVVERVTQLLKKTLLNQRHKEISILYKALLSKEPLLLEIMNGLLETKLLLQNTGYSAEILHEIEQLIIPAEPTLNKWLKAFTDPEEEVQLESPMPQMDPTVLAHLHLILEKAPKLITLIKKAPRPSSTLIEELFFIINAIEKALENTPLKEKPLMSLHQAIKERVDDATFKKILAQTEDKDEQDEEHHTAIDLAWKCEDKRDRNRFIMLLVKNKSYATAEPVKISLLLEHILANGQEFMSASDLEELQKSIRSFNNRYKITPSLLIQPSSNAGSRSTPLMAPLAWVSQTVKTSANGLSTVGTIAANFVYSGWGAISNTFWPDTRSTAQIAAPIQARQYENSSSFSSFRTMPDKITMASIGVSLSNHYSKQNGLFGYKPLSPKLAKQNQQQHEEQLIQLQAIWNTLGDRKYILRSVHYLKAKELFNEAQKRFDKHFSKKVIKISQSENKSLEQVLHQAMKSSTDLQALQMDLDVRYPELDSLIDIINGHKTYLHKINDEQDETEEITHALFYLLDKSDMALNSLQVDEAKNLLKWVDEAIGKLKENNAASSSFFEKLLDRVELMEQVTSEEIMVGVSNKSFVPVLLSQSIFAREQPLRIYGVAMAKESIDRTNLTPRLP